MKITSSVLLSLCLALVVRAQAQTPYEAVSPSPSSPTAIQRTPDVLDTLLGPIALYPDALVALILPASTSPTDVVLASRFLAAKNDQSTLNAQPWSDSVKALVHYPDVLKWMDENLPWTQSLGQAFLEQPADVMNALQRLRVRARVSGALVDTPQQQVITQGTTVVIVPAQPNVIYVPVYDPAVVYVQRTTWVNRPFITFGFGYPIGSGFIYDCDWNRGTVWVPSRPSNWRGQPQYWPRNASHPEKLAGQPWQPPTNYRPRPDTPIYLLSPAQIAPTPPVIPPPATLIQAPPRPVLVKPQTFTRPTRPFGSEVTNHADHNNMQSHNAATAAEDDSSKSDSIKKDPFPRARN